MKYETVIGLEVHAQLKTLSKIFCGCSTEFGASPNVNICPVCTGQPGVLPVLNKKVVELIVKTGLSLNCNINTHSIFARKQYFYPDLPKNYQISQYELPVAEHGWIDININNTDKRIGIRRIHLEEDAGKLVHSIGSRQLDYSLVDFNRTGIPLMEIVSEADLRSPEEAHRYLSILKDILEYLEVCDCDMEQGKFRCDANISLMPQGQKEFGTKTELKNMNTLKGVKDALEYEVERQTEVLSSGDKIIQETRLWDADKKSTYSMRRKEEAHDYRYFPEPDLVALEPDKKFIEEIRNTIPELPQQRKERFIKQIGLSGYDANLLTSEKVLADYYEQAIKDFGKEFSKEKTAKLVSNWITTELLGRLNADNKTISDSPITAHSLAELVLLIQKNTISGKIAKTVFEEMYNTKRLAQDIVKEKGLVQISDESMITTYCQEAIDENPKAVQEYKSGKEKAIGALVGSVMKKSKGKANPGIVNKILKEKLG